MLPCLDDVTVLATVTGERISLTPDAPTVGELNPDLNMALWNGLFVLKDTPADVREKIAAVASETVMSDRAQEIAAQTGALVYWMDAEASAALIEQDKITLGTVNSLLE